LYPSVKKVVPAEDFILSVEFDNGEHGMLDMKPFLDFGVFRRLKEPDVFKQVRVVFDTIEWDSKIDLDPEFVYDKCQKKGAQQGAQADASFIGAADRPLGVGPA